ncbi:MAG: hypothetical protein OEL77_04810 [Nitrosopumilus sp.]|nr:hypothetical protein [Nitrosopumilus sp.]MDH3385317.1 hypothetical protein [Nitrosopumilus sp.]
MNVVQEERNSTLMQKLCDKVRNLENVRFAGLISNFGNLYAGGFKEGVTPYENNERRRSMYMKFALESNFRKEFDDSFGTFNYSTIHREKTSILTMNICNYLFLVFTEPDVDLDALANKIKSMINENKNECCY